MAKGALIIAAAAALIAVALGRGRWSELAARLRGRATDVDPTIAQVPESRMPVTAQATVGPSTGARG